ncbi:MAG: 4-hydroxy-3-methylbut-2-enyl diphosphate reductase [Anderseniella sp.]|jgi:4-hydroxy-3-methylbut-2-enyl diphosphate reductase|nr:4-hydroxy-3-methylbut-2-enyl diphosphate reductase [Anderseniella sp.]
MSEQLPDLKIFLAAPRGFCAGVVRAIDIVERALELHGKPVYVRHEIVHNKYVVEDLKQKGAIFVEELDEVPDGDRPVIFSAHGVPKSVPAAAKSRNLFYLDATCPLVSKVHMEASRHYQDGYEIVLIGHAGHPEVIGTMGQLPDGAISLVEDEADVARFEPRDPDKLAYITQTTLSVDDTKGIIDALEKKFPNIHGPHKEDICYATTNRQESVKSVAPHCDMVLVVGAPNSSNSQRLVEVAKTAGSKQSMLVQRASEIDWDAMAGVKTLGITAGASAPEVLVNEVVDAFRARYNVTVETIKTKDENVEFKLPRQLRREGEPGAPVRSSTTAAE